MSRPGSPNSSISPPSLSGTTLVDQPDDAHEASTLDSSSNISPQDVSVEATPPTQPTTPQMTLEEKIVFITERFRRLEAATSRLEDLVPTPDGTRSSSDALESQNDDMNGSYASAEQSSTATQPSQQEQLPPAIKAFNTLIDTEVKNFLDKSQQVGSLVADQVRDLHHNTST